MNDMERDVFHKEYMPYIIKWGKITCWLSIPLIFVPAIALYIFYQAVPSIGGVITGFICSATSFLRNWDSILEKKRANLRSISEPARLRQPPPQKHGSGTRKRAGSKHTGGATNSRPSRAFCPLVG